MINFLKIVLALIIGIPSFVCMAATILVLFLIAIVLIALAALFSAPVVFAIYLVEPDHNF